MQLVSENLNESIKYFKEKNIYENNVTSKNIFESADVIPDDLINTFYKRIKERLDLHGGDKNHPLVKKEIDRVIFLNGKIPDKIKDLLNESELFENLLFESLNEEFNVEKIKNLIEKIKDKKTLLHNLIKKFNKTKNNLKLRKYIANVIVLLFLTNFAIKNNQWAESAPAKETMNSITTEILHKEKISVPELLKITDIKIPGVYSKNTRILIEKAIDIVFAKTSESAKNSIKESEKLSLKAYTINYRVKDKNGKIVKKNDGMITIGYGHAEPIKTSKYKIGDIITEKKANELFKNDIIKAEEGVKRMFLQWKAEGRNVKITQNMFDAMVSMAYNMGISRLRQTEFVKHLKDNNHVMAAKDIKIAGISKKYPGLIPRRQMEYNLFAKDL